MRFAQQLGSGLPRDGSCYRLPQQVFIAGHNRDALPAPRHSHLEQLFPHPLSGDDNHIDRFSLTTMGSDSVAVCELFVVLRKSAAILQRTGPCSSIREAVTSSALVARKPGSRRFAISNNLSTPIRSVVAILGVVDEAASIRAADAAMAIAHAT